MILTQTFEDIVHEHHATITRIAATYEAAPHLIEELVQDIYLAIWRSLPSFRGEASLRTFVVRIATNRAVTHVVRAMKAPMSAELDAELPSSAETPEDRAIARDQTAGLMGAVRQLPLPFRQVVILMLEGLTTAEIGEVLGVSPNAVAIRMSRAKGLLRTLMGERR